MRPDTNILYLSFICALLRANKITFEQIYNGLTTAPPPDEDRTYNQPLSMQKDAVLQALTHAAKASAEPRAMQIVATIRDSIIVGRLYPDDLKSIVRSTTTDDVTAEMMMVAYFAVAIDYEPTIQFVLDPFFVESEDALISDERSLVPGTNLTIAINLLKGPLLKATKRGHLVDKMLRVLQGKILGGHLRYQRMIAVFKESDPDDVPTETPRPYRVR